jgi:hypothetical protein
MSSCIAKADKICGDDGYTIRSGVNRKHLLGGSSSSQRAMSEIAELTIVCGLEEAEEEEATFKLPPRTDAPVQEEGQASPTAEAPSAAVCTPGATQRCVGPGACDGGQVCLDDGSAFGPCDCGGGSAPAAPTSQPASAPDGGPTSLSPAPKGPPATTAVPGAAPAPEPLSK